MNKIWKHSTNGTIVINSVQPDGDYTDETNIANWIGMMRKIGMTLIQIQSEVGAYLDEKVQLKVELSDYDNKWLEIYNNLSSSSSIDDLIINNDHPSSNIDDILLDG